MHDHNTHKSAESLLNSGHPNDVKLKLEGSERQMDIKLNHRKNKGSQSSGDQEEH
jgi:hypothetical protein